jgi:hypothetical protein
MGEPIQVGEAKGGNRRALKLVAVAIAALAAVVVLPGLMFGGGSSPSTEDAFGSIEVDTGAPPATVPDGDPPPETVQVFSSKNPFRPLVDTTPTPTEPVGAAVADPTTVTTLPFDSFVFDDYVVPDEGAPVAPDPDPAPAPAAPAGPVAPPRAPDRVSLLEVFTDLGGQVVASIRVNDITHQVAETGDFAGMYRVVDLDAGNRCAQLLFGDAPFGLCEGDEVIK